jgi:hypothetical protein
VFVFELSNRRSAIMKYSQFKQRKNDFAFAFVMAAMFAVTVVGAVAGYVDMARGRLGADSAKTQGPSLALRGPAEQVPHVANAGERK